MNFLSVEKVSKAFGDRVLFEDLSFGIEKGQKVALIAANGTGKTTLLNIITGKETADTGKVIFNQNIRFEYLAQEPDLPEHLSVADLIFYSDQPAIKALKAYETAFQNHANNPSPETEREFNEAIQLADAHQIWDYEHKAHEILERLEVNFLDKKIGVLSGGQRKRVAMARLLVNDPDLLILDEPTNHLDIEMIEWLEEYLGKSNITLLLVTHDRFFLDRITDEIFEIENKTIYRYKGNYEYFLTKKEERVQTENAETEKARNLMRKELEWVRRQPKARGTKAKARLDAFDDLKGKTQGRKEEKEISISLKMNRLGGKILELKNISHSYPNQKILQNLTYTFKKGERLGIVGKNGCGKSTFLKIVTGDLQANSGSVVVGDTIVFGYYNQDGLKFDESKRVIDVIREIADYISLDKEGAISASQLLTRFNFPPDRQYSFVYKLSGGEKRRLYLLTILMKNPNFLILDEPTNDLDLLTLQTLEEFLDSYGGCLIIVSHDRYFLNRLTEHLFIFENGGELRDFNGTYEEYRLDLEERKKQKSLEEKAEKERIKNSLNEPNPIKVEKRKATYKENKEFESLSNEIAALESDKNKLVDLLSSGSGSSDEIRTWGERLQEIQKSLEEKEMRWLELSEIIN